MLGYKIRVIQLKIVGNLDLLIKFVHFFNVLQKYLIWTQSAGTQNQRLKIELGPKKLDPDIPSFNLIC